MIGYSRAALLLLIVALALGACSSRPQSSLNPLSTITVSPFVSQSGGSTPHWEAILTNTETENAGYPVVGPDRNIWFITCCNQSGTAGGIGKITMTGAITLYPLPAYHYPGEMVRGPKSDLWFVEQGSNGSIDRMTTDGQLTQYALPIPNEAADSLTMGPDRNIWFSEYQPGFQQQMIGRVRPDGHFLPSFNIVGGPAMTTGPDGRVWVAVRNSTSIEAITQTGQVTVYSGLSSPANWIIPGPDGNVWFTEGSYVGKITTSGQITEYSEPSSIGIFGITVGPDKHLWFAMEFAQDLGRISLTGQTQFLQNPFPYQEGGSITKGPDGNIWFGEAGYLGVFIRLVLSVQPSSIDFTQVGQTQVITVSEKKYHGLWTATSQDPSVATVSPASNNTFTVTAVGSGSTSIDVADSTGNDFLVSVTVP